MISKVLNERSKVFFTRKHGFYSPVRDKDQKHRLKQAALVKGLDEEISLLRVKIQSVVEHEPGNTKLILQAVLSLARLLRTSNKLGFGKEELLGEAIRDIISDYKIHLDMACSKDTQNKSI